MEYYSIFFEIVFNAIFTNVFRKFSIYLTYFPMYLKYYPRRSILYSLIKKYFIKIFFLFYYYLKYFSESIFCIFKLKYFFLSILPPTLELCDVCNYLLRYCVCILNARKFRIPDKMRQCATHALLLIHIYMSFVRCGSAL